MKLLDLMLIVVLFTSMFAFARAADYVSWWDDTDHHELHVDFERGQANEFLRIVQDSNGYLQYTLNNYDIDAVDYTGWPYILVGGQQVKGTDAWCVHVYMGDGTNHFLNSQFAFNRFNFYGGDGNDFTRSVDFGQNGLQRFYLYEGPTQNDFEAQNAKNCVVYSDLHLYANSSQWPNSVVKYVLGENSHAIIWSSFAGTTMYFIPVSATAVISDSSAQANSVYSLLDGNGNAGELYIFEHGGTDTFYKNGHAFNVSGTTVSGEMTGSFQGWSGVESVHD